jgi:hypothetical protein
MKKTFKTIKKEKIFKLFSQNLEWVKEHPSIRFKPDFSNGYICPLCFETFFEKDLDATLENYLTLEDIPPKSLGGKPLALTCKKCNSRSGHELDVHLLNNRVLPISNFIRRLICLPLISPETLPAISAGKKGLLAVPVTTLSDIFNALYL